MGEVSFVSGAGMSSPPDFYAPEDQRDELVEAIGKSKAKIFNKRLTCKDYCDKLLNHIQLMRTDLLVLDNNEDAIAIHEEMKGITDCMNIFGIGLDQSVMNEPTGINLSDWANLCLFRLAIARRRITTIKIYVDKTGSAEALYKIEAYLYYSYEFLNTGELDEYESEMIQEDSFWNIGFLMGHSSIADPTKKSEQEEKPEILEPMKESDSESEDSEKSEESNNEKEAHSEEEAEKTDLIPDEETEKTENTEPTKDEIPDVSETKSEEEKTDQTSEKEKPEESEKSEKLEKSEKSEKSSTGDAASDESASKLEKAKSDFSKEKSPKQDGESTTPRRKKKKKRKPRTERSGSGDALSPKIVRSPSQSPRKKKRKKKKLPSTKSLPTDDIKNAIEREEPKKEEKSEKKNERSPQSPSKSPSQSGFKLRFGTLGRKKKAPKLKTEGSQEMEDIESPKQSRLASLFSLSPLPGRSDSKKPLSARDPHKERRSLSSFGRKKISDPSMEPPIIRGEIFVFKGSSSKKRWGILNSEMIEIYKDNGCLHLSKALRVVNFEKVILEQNEEEKKKKNQILFSIQLETSDSSIHFGMNERAEQLEWAIGLCCAAEQATGKSLHEAKEELVKELYTNKDEKVEIKNDDEIWVIEGGNTLTCIGTAMEYSWDGLNLKFKDGDDVFENLAEISWDGYHLTVAREDHTDTVFHWIPCTGEFRSPVDPQTDSCAAVWNWSEEQFVQFLPIIPDEAPRMWKYSEEVPAPLVMSVEILSLLRQKKPLVPRVARLRGSSIRERAEERKEKKKRNLKKENSKPAGNAPPADD